MKDMTVKQFCDALKRHGMTLTGVLGYVEVGEGLAVSRFNAGYNRRRQLAYLLQEQEEHYKKLGKDVPLFF